MLLAQLSDDAIVVELGRRIALHRVGRNLTQSELADRAGVARSTVQRIERGDSIQLSSLVKLLRVVDRLDALDVALEAELRSPVAELRRQRARRRRVRHGRDDQGGPPPDSDGGAWTWGEEGDSG
ncbi:MAG: helix-turn-helix transcriptional regulator [Solirubrobacteraceae bacterium]